MKFALLAVSCLSLLPVSALAQTPVDTTVCEITASPQSFDGKWVRITGTVRAGFDEFVIRDTSCSGREQAVWLAYPEGTKGQAGPAAMLQIGLAKNSAGTVEPVTRTPVMLNRSGEFQQFDTLLSAPVRVSALCPGCVGNAVHATLVGRLDGVANPGVVREGKRVVGVRGFGNLNGYAARLVIQGVSAVTAIPSVYADAGDRAAIPPSDSASESKALTNRWRRANEAWGAPGEDNGVVVSNMTGADLVPGDEKKSDTRSPDGAIYTARFAMSRLPGRALGVAMAHMGVHIAELRGAVQPSDTAGAEFRAWEISVFDILVNGPDALQAPGGRVLWSKSWWGQDNARIAAARILAFLGEP